MFFFRGATSVVSKCGNGNIICDNTISVLITHTDIPVSKLLGHRTVSLRQHGVFLLLIIVNSNQRAGVSLPL